MADVPAHVAWRVIQKEEQEAASQDPPHGQPPGWSTPEKGNEARTPMTLCLLPGRFKNKQAGWWSDRSPVGTMQFAGRIVGRAYTFRRGANEEWLVSRESGANATRGQATLRRNLFYREQIRRHGHLLVVVFSAFDAGEGRPCR
jgi:hypothetical protein